MNYNFDDQHFNPSYHNFYNNNTHFDSSNSNDFGFYNQNFSNQFGSNFQHDTSYNYGPNLNQYQPNHCESSYETNFEVNYGDNFGNNCENQYKSNFQYNNENINNYGNNFDNNNCYEYECQPVYVQPSSRSTPEQLNRLDIIEQQVIQLNMMNESLMSLARNIKEHYHTSNLVSNDEMSLEESTEFSNERIANERRVMKEPDDVHCVEFDDDDDTITPSSCDPPLCEPSEPICDSELIKPLDESQSIEDDQDNLEDEPIEWGWDFDDQSDVSECSENNEIVSDIQASEEPMSVDDHFDDYYIGDDIEMSAQPILSEEPVCDINETLEDEECIEVINSFLENMEALQTPNPTQNISEAELPNQIELEAEFISLSLISQCEPELTQEISVPPRIENATNDPIHMIEIDFGIQSTLPHFMHCPYYYDPQDYLRQEPFFSKPFFFEPHFFHHTFYRGKTNFCGWLNFFLFLLIHNERSPHWSTEDRFQYSLTIFFLNFKITNLVLPILKLYVVFICAYIEDNA